MQTPAPITPRTPGEPRMTGASAGPGLRRHTLGRAELLANNVSECAPAIATFFVLGGIVSAAGVGTPLVVLIAGFGFFMHANVNAEFARMIPSAGFYSTYNARAFNRPTGSIIACAYLIGMGCFYVGVYLQIGVWVSVAVANLFGVSFSWWIPTVVMWAVVTALLLRGVKVSVRVAVAMFTFELLVLLAAAAAMLVFNHGSISGVGFEPGKIQGGTSGLGLGFPLAIFLLLGVTGSSPLAEETKNPRRNLPFAIRVATLIGIAIYVFNAWVTGIGFKNNVGALVKTAFPFITGATNAVPDLRYVMYLAGFSSALGVMLSTGNAGSRVLFNISRDGLLPGIFERTHKSWHTPWIAILLPNCALLAATLILGGIVGGENGFNYAVTLATDVLVVVFIITNIALIVYTAKFAREKFSWLRYVAIPVAGIVALGFPLYTSVLPSQPRPYNWFGVLILGAYAIAITYVLIRRHATGRVGVILADEAAR